MELIMIYTIAVSMALLLFYPVVNCIRYITWQLTQHYPRVHRTFQYFFNSLLPSALNFWLLLLLSLVPGTALFVRNLQYPLILPRKYWMSITRLEFLMLILYFVANSTILVLERVNVGQTAAMLAVVNAAPLFLGGRANPLVDLIGVPLSTYYIFHHFIGRVVVIEGMIHAILAFRRSRLDQTTTSGYIAVGSLILLLLTSFHFMRRYFFRSFAKTHLALALVMLGATTWHVLTRNVKQSKITVLVYGGFWVLKTIYMSIRLIFYATGASIIEKSSGYEDDFEVSRITVSCNHRFHHYPGSYFYMFPSGSFFHYNLLASYPMAVLWYEPDIKEDRTELTFLVLHKRRLKSLRFMKGEKLLIDGPYGQDLNLRYFKTVMLTAHGSGILGVLSIARGLWERRRSDYVVRRVNIFWSLDQNSQGEWAAPYLKRLQELDAHNELFVVWCVYPTEEKETPAFKETSHWLYFHQIERDLLLKHMMDATATSESSIVVGKYPEYRNWAGLTVAACGDPDFSANVRKTVIDHRATRHIDFVEVQYRPSTMSFHSTNGESEKNYNKLSNDVDLEKGEGKLSSKNEEKGRGMISTFNDGNLDKGMWKPRRMDEDEGLDDVSLSPPLSPSSTLVDGASPNTWQKKRA